MNDFSKPLNYWFSSPNKNSFFTVNGELADWLQDEFKKNYRTQSVISGSHNISKEDEKDAHMYILHFNEDELEKVRNIYVFADQSYAFSRTKDARSYMKGFLSAYKKLLLESLLIEESPLGFAALSDYADEYWIPKSPSQTDGRLWSDEHYNFLVDEVTDLYNFSHKSCAREFIADIHSYRNGLLDEIGLEDRTIVFAKEFTNQLTASHPKQRGFIYKSDDHFE